MTSLRTLLFALALFTLTSSALAADAKPTPGQLAIQQLVGKWSGKGTIKAEGKTHQVAMSWDCAVASGGAGTKCKGVITGLPGFTYEFDDVWGYSTADGLVHWFTVTNAGEVHDHAGHLDQNGGQLAVSVPMQGKLLSEVITFTCKGPSMIMSWMTTLGGAPHEQGQIELRK